MANTKKLSIFFLGLALGAVAGLLLAPDKGSKSRKKMRRRGKEMVESAKENAAAFGGKIKDSMRSF
jgi:gas vesicle protein